MQFTALWADLGTVLIERAFYDKALSIFAELAENEEVSRNPAVPARSDPKLMSGYPGV